MEEYELELGEPNIALKKQYLNLCRECENDKLNTGFLGIVDEASFEAEINKIIGYSRGIGLENGWVPGSTLWLYSKKLDVIIGVINIRHSLTENLRFRGGHIGYYIRPSERNRGFATEMLRLAVEKCTELGMKNILITCSKSNVGSSKVIINNGGILDSEDSYGNDIFLRYWINT